MDKKIFSAGLVLSVLLFFAPFTLRRTDPLFDSVFSPSLGGIPVQRAGRVMPLSSASADVLRCVGGRRTAVFNGETVSSSKWFWLVNAKPSEILSQNIVGRRNRNLDLLLGDGGSKSSYGEFLKHYKSLRDSASAPAASRAAKRAVEAGINYALASNAVARILPGCGGAASSLKKWRKLSDSSAGELENALRDGRIPDVKKFEEAYKLFEDIDRVGQFEASNADLVVKTVPAGKTFYTPSGALLDANARNSPILDAYALIHDDLARGDGESALARLPDLEKLLEETSVDLLKVGVENILNAVDPFFGGLILYGASLLICALAFLWRSGRPGLSSLAFALLLSAVCAHAAGIVARMYIQGRPPVANLYSSLVFAGDAAAAMGLVLYARKRYWSLAAAAAAAGFLSLLAAVNLPYGGDTLGRVGAVLNSNFWLAVHVLTITTGFCAVFLAGFISAARLTANAFSRGNFGEESGRTAKTVYGVLRFALFFSFAGTMLGGIWADMSWGRFWGWDPKENGALAVILWLAFCIHARAFKMCSDRLFLATAVFGNVVAAWAWFGVDLMGVGLHSYGFMDGGWFWFSAFALSQISIMPLALVKYRDASPPKL